MRNHGLSKSLTDARVRSGDYRIGLRDDPPVGPERLATDLLDKREAMNRASARPRATLRERLGNALAAPRLGRSRAYNSVFVDLNDVSRGPFSPGDDRMNVGVSLDLKALCDLRVEEGIERILASAERVDLSSHLHLITTRCAQGGGETRCF